MSYCGLKQAYEIIEVKTELGVDANAKDKNLNDVSRYEQFEQLLGHLCIQLHDRKFADFLKELLRMPFHVKPLSPSFCSSIIQKNVSYIYERKLPGPDVYPHLYCEEMINILKDNIPTETGIVFLSEEEEGRMCVMNDMIFEAKGKWKELITEDTSLEVAMLFSTWATETQLFFIIEEIKNNFVEISNNCCGCFFVQKIIEAVSHNPFQSVLLSSICKQNAMSLIQSEFGISVILKVIQRFSPVSRNFVITTFCNHAEELSKNKFSSALFQKLLQCASISERIALIESLVPSVLSLSTCEVGNFVIRQAICFPWGVCRDEDNSKLKITSILCNSISSFAFNEFSCPMIVSAIPQLPIFVDQQLCSSVLMNVDIVYLSKHFLGQRLLYGIISFADDQQIKFITDSLYDLLFTELQKSSIHQRIVGFLLKKLHLKGLFHPSEPKPPKNATVYYPT
ncbi:uncharacterized protein MONOS_18521 [Monocercomonoides exilis]|uniref:uncharacterized protein n=1 Tax=Monocercomonoides exilis TaxID=2049356 RepID=UPI003559F74A|nr:hypothetical protein MONOS_18521 [Monocercomonoides exilis]